MIKTAANRTRSSLRLSGRNRLTRSDKKAHRAFNRKVGLILRRLRHSKGMSRHQVVLATGISIQAYKHFEIGSASIPGCTFFQLVNIFEGSRLRVECSLFEASHSLRNVIGKIPLAPTFKFPLLSSNSLTTSEIVHPVTAEYASSLAQLEF